MKFTVICITLLSISATWADKEQKAADQTKGKRGAELSYQSSVDHGQSSQGYQIQSSIDHSQSPQGYQIQSSVGHGQSSQGYQIPSYGKGDASAVSIGAGYSIGGAKPSFNYGPPETADSLQPNQHHTVQLAPIMLHPSNGGIISGDLQKFMSELSHGLNTGAITLSPYTGEQSTQGHSISLSQLSTGAPSHQYQIQEQPESNVPHYAAGTKGLGSYSSNGPVLFQPSSAHAQPSFSYASPSSGHSLSGLSGLSLASGHSSAGLGDSGHGTRTYLSGYSLGGSGSPKGGSPHYLTLGKPGLSFLSSGNSIGSDHVGYSLGNSGQLAGGSGYSLGGAAHSLDESSGHSLGDGYASGGHSLGDSGHSFGGSSHSLGGSGYTLGSHSLGGSGYGSGGHSLGGSGHSFGSLKGFGGHYGIPSKASFKPSTLLNVYSDSNHGSHGLSSFSGSYKGPMFGSHPGHGLSLSSGNKGISFVSSSTKIPHSYLPSTPESYSGSHDSYAALSSHSQGPTASPPGSSYGIPQSAYSASASHAASSHSPRYIYSSKNSPSHISKEISSYRAPSFSRSSLSSFSSSKYSPDSHGSPSVRYFSGSDDSNGAHSENTYNTIKYSAEMKPSTPQH